MNSPIISVIIPAYKGANVIGNAIQSVLDQTYPHFEIIVVSDASPDHTEEIVKNFADPRIRYIAHPENRGLPATRNTGVRAAIGQYIALLDQDDLFHPEKLQVHVDCLEKNPQVGVTYNSRFEIIGSTEGIRSLWQAPQNVGLPELLLGYPFAPSDMVLRREWLLNINLFDESNTFHGEDLNTNCRLALAGCTFASVNRALNYRRYEPARIRRDLERSLTAVFRNIQLIVSDPRCPAEVIALYSLALANNYQVWSYWAFAQDETAFGQNCLREAIRLNPALLDGNPCELLNFYVTYCVDDERGDLDQAMRRLFDQFPPELQTLSRQYDWALGKGYLLKGTRLTIWNLLETSDHYFSEAARLSAQIDESFIQMVVHQLVNLESEFGSSAAQNALTRLAPYFEQVNGQRAVRHLQGTYLINKAFRNFRMGRYASVPGDIFRSVQNEPAYLVNRGVVSILLRSMIGTLSPQRVN